MRWSYCHVRCQPVRVPRFEAFPALRYAPSLPLQLVNAPPYDVLSAVDVAHLAARHPRNIVHIDVPAEVPGRDRYEVAGEQLRAWVHEGSLRRDADPSFTLYRMSFTDEAGDERETVGVIGALEVVDEGASGVLPHERTTPKAKTDRLDLTRATLANLSPVWGLSLTSGLSALLAQPGEAVGACTDEQDVVHTVERVTDPARVAAISQAVAQSPVLIADGHHRYAISRTYRDEVRAARGEHSGAELTMAYVSELVGEQLSIDAIHRLYDGTTADALLNRLGASFDLVEAGQVDASFAAAMVERQSLCLVRPDRSGVWLTPRPDAFRDVRHLDGAFLEHAMLGMNIDVSYQHGIAHVVDAVAAGRASVGVLIRPTSIDEIRRTADERLLMPPKSTFFTPKLRTGLVLRPID